jgi:hypothetical protein
VWNINIVLYFLEALEFDKPDFIAKIPIALIFTLLKQRLLSCVTVLWLVQWEGIDKVDDWLGKQGRESALIFSIYEFKASCLQIETEFQS